MQSSDIHCSDPRRYTACYCEENIHLLSQHMLQQESAQDSRAELFVVFVSSMSKATPIWCQRSNKESPESPVMWDYHVFLLLKSFVKSEPNLIYDYDTTLSFPVDSCAYINLAFRPTLQLRPEFEQTFRVISAQNFVDRFASDRSHMLVNGKYSSPVPVWAALRGSAAETENNIQAFIDMTLNTRYGFYGEVMRRREFFDWAMATTT